MGLKDNTTVVAVPRESVIPWLLNKHYAKRVPQITHSFGCFVDGVGWLRRGLSRVCFV